MRVGEIILLIAAVIYVTVCAAFIAITAAASKACP